MNDFDYFKGQTSAQDQKTDVRVSQTELVDQFLKQLDLAEQAFRLSAAGSRGREWAPYRDLEEHHLRSYLRAPGTSGARLHRRAALPLFAR